MRAIDTARHTTLSRFLNGLGIPHVGAQTAGDLAAHFGSLGAIRGASEAEIRAVPGISPVVARDVADFFRRAANRRVIDLCRDRGVVVGHPTPETRAVGWKGDCVHWRPEPDDA